MRFYSRHVRRTAFCVWILLDAKRKFISSTIFSNAIQPHSNIWPYGALTSSPITCHGRSRSTDRHGWIAWRIPVLKTMKNTNNEMFTNTTILTDISPMQWESSLFARSKLNHLAFRSTWIIGFWFIRKSIENARWSTVRCFDKSVSNAGCSSMNQRTSKWTTMKPKVMPKRFVLLWTKR